MYVLRWICTSITSAYKPRNESKIPMKLQICYWMRSEGRDLTVGLEQWIHKSISSSQHWKGIFYLSYALGKYAGHRLFFIINGSFKCCITIDWHKSIEMTNYANCSGCYFRNIGFVPNCRLQIHFQIFRYKFIAWKAWTLILYTCKKVFRHVLIYSYKYIQYKYIWI